MRNENKTVSETQKTVTISIEEYEALQSASEALHDLKAENARLNQQVQWLLEGIKLSRKQLFGASSEKSSASEQLSFLFNEAEVYEDQSAAQEDESVPVAAHKRKRRSGSVKDVLPENVPVDVVEHRLSEEERICDECGTIMEEIGKEIRRTLQIIPAQVRIREDWYYTYACQQCRIVAENTPIVKAEKTPAVIPGSFASPEAIAHIMTQKFVMGSPLYRQEQEFERMGVHLSRQTMSNWILRAAQDWLKPVYECLHAELVKSQVLHADETTLQVLHEPGKSAHTDSYMWLYRTSGDTDRHIVLYEYQPDRKAEHPKEFLKEFSGYLHTDGYKGYHALPEGIHVVGCWAHARRYFDQAVKIIPAAERKNSEAYKGWSYCNQLFSIEDKLKKCSPEERYNQRQKRAKPVLDAFLRWAQNRKAAPQSTFGKAIHYLLEQWPYLLKYLEDGRLEISNNRAERSIKPFVIDRKNFLFANTPGGAQGSAIIFSMIETAKENGLDPYRYLVWLLSMAAKTDAKELQMLLPWNAPEKCKAAKS